MNILYILSNRNLVEKYSSDGGRKLKPMRQTPMQMTAIMETIR